MLGWLRRLVGTSRDASARAPSATADLTTDPAEQTIDGSYRSLAEIGLSQEDLQASVGSQRVGQPSRIVPPGPPVDGGARSGQHFSAGPNPRIPNPWIDAQATGTHVAPRPGVPGQATVSRSPSASGVAARLPECRVVIRCGPQHRHQGSRIRHRREDTQWVPPGSSITVHGRIIPGMVYVGRFMPTNPNGDWGADIAAPCLIDPSLPIASARVPLPTEMGYWPSYSDITPEQRAAYLTWLATGKRDTSFPVGYAFLYFYALERRLLAEAPSPSEEGLLVAELERLRELYAASTSFRNYSGTLLQVLQARRLSAVPGGFAAWRPDLSDSGRARGLPLLLQMKVALHAGAGIPLDCDHALAAMLAIPPAQGGMPTSPGLSRTRDEFIELVRRRFAQRFPDGFLPPPRQDRRLALGYQAAARHLDVAVSVQCAARLPDPISLNWAEMADLCTTAAEDLKPYARLVGKDRDRAATMAAAMVLPDELADRGPAAAFRAWLDQLPQPVAHVPLPTLAQQCFGDARSDLSLKQVREVSAMLARVGYGMEPDPTHGGDKPDQEVLLFRSGEAVLSPAFAQAALAMASLAATVSDPARMVTDLVSRLRLSGPEAIRLAARCRLSRDRPIAASKLKMLVAAFPAQDRAEMAAMAASAAAASGEITHEITISLERLFDACGVDRRKLYGVLHQSTAKHAVPATGPVPVQQDTSQTRTFRIPPKPDRAAAAGASPSPSIVSSEPLPDSREENIRQPVIPARVPAPVPDEVPVDGVAAEAHQGSEPRKDGGGKAVSSGLSIDMAKVQAILNETRAVTEVLAPIYAEETNSMAVVPGTPQGARQTALEDGSGRVSRFDGLNADHARLLQGLSAQDRWSRAEFEAKARALGLLPDGAIETINEWAFDAFDDALIEDGDPLTINVALLPEAPEEAA
jgi:hypothetical protein